MQKIEKWRIQELKQVVESIVEILESCEQYEWASVFRHYNTEIRQILQKPHFDSSGLMSLLRSIRGCLRDGQSLRTLASSDRNVTEHYPAYQRLLRRIADLYLILEHMEKRFTDTIH